MRVRDPTFSQTPARRPGAPRLATLWPPEPDPTPGRTTPPASRRARGAAALVAFLLVIAVLGAGVAWPPRTGPRRPRLSPLRARIVAIAQSQVGYRTDPADTYCNKFSAYWNAGVDDCGNGNLDEEWCADFAAWAWKQAGAEVDYQLAPGYLNADSASFYVWGVDHGTWHPVGSGYTPQPGDVAVYGLDTTAVTAVHVAVVTGGDRQRRGARRRQRRRRPHRLQRGGGRARIRPTPTSRGRARPLSGYVSPSPPPAARLVLSRPGARRSTPPRPGLLGRHGHDHRLEHLGRVPLDVAPGQHQAPGPEEGDRQDDEERRAVVVPELRRRWPR